MAQVFGSAGKSAFAMGDSRYNDMLSRIVLPMLAFLLLMPAGYFLLTRGHFLLGAVVAFTYVVSIKSLEEAGLKLKKRVTDADTGAKAEQAVAIALQELPDDYYVFNDLEFPGFNIDHVVLGPNGIFLVETKSQTGNITQENDVLLRNGRKFFKDFLKQCWRQTYSLRNHLGAEKLRVLSINPILCFSRGFVEIRDPVRGVAVLNVGYLRPYILSQRGSVAAQLISNIIPILAAAVSNQAAQASLTAHQHPIGGIVCPKCFHERTNNDDLFRSASECPKCGVIYARAQADTTGTTPTALSSSPKDLSTAMMSLLPFLPKRFPFTLLKGLALSKSKPTSSRFSWNILALKLSACALAAALLIGAYKTIQTTVASIFSPAQTRQVNIDSSHSQPVIQAPPTATCPGPIVDFPLTHSVASKEIQNTIPFIFQEDRGQNVILILFNPQTNKLLMRACVRAGEKLTSSLPQGEFSFLLVTGPAWYGFEDLFGERGEARKVITILSSKPEKGSVSKFLATTNLLIKHGAPSTFTESKTLVGAAFKHSGGFLKI